MKNRPCSNFKYNLKNRKPCSQIFIFPGDVAIIFVDRSWDTLYIFTVLEYNLYKDLIYDVPIILYMTYILRFGNIIIQ